MYRKIKSKIYRTFVRALAIFSSINNDAVSCKADFDANKLDISIAQLRFSIAFPLFAETGVGCELLLFLVE